MEKRHGCERRIVADASGSACVASLASTSLFSELRSSEALSPEDEQDGFPPAEEFAAASRTMRAVVGPLNRPCSIGGRSLTVNHVQQPPSQINDHEE